MHILMHILLNLFSRLGLFSKCLLNSAILFVIVIKLYFKK